jgi:hypothetical protein
MLYSSNIIYFHKRYKLFYVKSIFTTVQYKTNSLLYLYNKNKIFTNTDELL